MYLDFAKMISEPFLYIIYSMHTRL